MALAQPTPIIGSVKFNNHGDPNNGYTPIYKELTILDVPGPPDSFAVVDLYVPDDAYFGINDNFYIGQKLFWNGKFPYIGQKAMYNFGGNAIYMYGVRSKGIIVPGGERLWVKFYSAVNPNVNIGAVDIVLTATGLFYKNT